jgi:hypothetical protein
MSQIHFVGGEKGGVGKSCVTRLLAQCFIDHHIPFTAFDADQSHGEMLRFYADFSRSVNLADGDDMDGVFESALESDQRVLVDLPSQSEHLLKSWMDESGIIELAEAEGVPLVFWHVMDDGKNSVNLLEHVFDYYSGSANVRFVVVENRGRGIDFSYFEQSPVRRAVDKFGAEVLSLGELNRKVMNKIDRMSLSFWAARHLDRGQCLNKMERQRVNVWVNRWYTEVQKVPDFLFPRQTAEVVPFEMAHNVEPFVQVALDQQALSQ